LKEEARTVALMLIFSRSVRADFEENDRDVSGAETEVAFRFVTITGG